VFAGLFVLLAGVGWLSARMARRASAAAGPGGTPGYTRAPAVAGRPATATSGAATSRAATSGAGTGGAGTSAAPAALARILPFATVAIAALVPLAAGLYLATSTAWTLAERAGLAAPRRRGQPWTTGARLVSAHYNRIRRLALGRSMRPAKEPVISRQADDGIFRSAESYDRRLTRRRQICRRITLQSDSDSSIYSV
jgi:hypothetical protein